MIFWLSYVDHVVPNYLHFVLSVIIVTGIKLYLSDFFVYPPFPAGFLLQQWYMENIINFLLPKNL